jgi:hypothetical protein
MPQTLMPPYPRETGGFGAYETGRPARIRRFKAVKSIRAEHRGQVMVGPRRLLATQSACASPIPGQFTTSRVGGSSHSGQASCSVPDQT